MSLAQPPLAAEEKPEFKGADLTALEKSYKEAERNQNDIDRLNRENIAFLEDIQWIHVTERGMLNLSSVQRGQGKLRIIDNRLLDNARRLHARVVDARFLPDVIQETEDPGDRQAAKAARGALRWFERRKELAPIKSDIALWIVAVGQAYLETYFDPEAGPQRPVPVIDEATGESVMEPALDDAGQPIMVEEPVTDPLTGQPAVDPLTGDPQTQTVPQMRPAMKMESLGDVDVTIRSAFQVKRDPRFQEWKKLRWLFVDEPAAREEILDRFGEGVPDLNTKLPEDTKAQPLPWVPDVARSVNITDADLTGVPKPPPGVTGTITLRRYYERPSRKHPKGRQIIYIPEAMIQVYPTNIEEEERGLGTPDNDFSLVPFGYLNRPWILEARSPVSSGKVLQRVYNRLFSRFGEHLIRLAGGYLMVPTTSGIPKGAFTNEIGSIIRYMPAGGKPEILFPQYGGLQWYEVFLNRIERSFEERMALPAVSRGQRVPGVKTWRGLELLREEADKIQSPVLMGLAWSYARVYTKVLGLMKRHFTVERLVSFQGEANRAEAFEFKNDTLPDDWQDRMSVKVQSDEGLPSSKMARTELVLRLAKDHEVFGKAGTPGYVRKLRDALEFDAGFLTSEEDLDITIAEHENLLLTQGQQVPLHEFDDDIIHIRTHLTYIKRMVASGRAEQTPLHRQHVVAHRQALILKVRAVQGPPAPPAGAQSGAQPGGGPAGAMTGTPGAMPGSESEEGLIADEEVA